MIDDYDNVDYDYFNEWDLEQAKKEYLRLYSIIKEAREYIESYMPNYDFDKTNLIKLLEMLDKALGSDKE